MIYYPIYYQAFPDYQALILELESLVGQYQKAESTLDEKKDAISVKGATNLKNPIGSGAPTAAIAGGVQALNVLASAATLFRTDTEYKVNQEEIGEDVLVSLIRKNDTSSTTKYFFPALYLPIGGKDSELLKKIGELEKAQKELLTAVASKEVETQGIETEISGLKESIAQKEKEISELPEEGGDSRKKKLGDELTAENNQLKQKKTDLQARKEVLVPVQQVQKALDTVYAGITEYLAQPVGKESNVSMLRQFLRVEKLLEKMKDPKTYTLRLTAKASGTNRITKFLWWTCLKHSAGVEARYQLFDHEANLVSADAVFEYTKFKKNSQISQEPRWFEF